MLVIASAKVKTKQNFMLEMVTFFYATTESIVAVRGKRVGSTHSVMHYELSNELQH